MNDISSMYEGRSCDVGPGGFHTATLVNTHVDNHRARLFIFAPFHAAPAGGTVHGTSAAPTTTWSKAHTLQCSFSGKHGDKSHTLWLMR